MRPLYIDQFRASGLPRLHEPVIIDDNKDSDFLSLAKEKFRDLGKIELPRVHLIGKVRFRGSGPDESIQLADMVCGACGAWEDGNIKWYSFISERNLEKSDHSTA